MRYSDRPFPSYTYVPGKCPHPRSDASGHSFGEPEPHVAAFDVGKWRESCEYLYGIDLYNAEFYWESHEQWEALWHSVGRRSEVADFLKGLIKLAAANVKRLEGNDAGVQRHANRAAQLFAEVCMSHEVMAGLELTRLVDIAKHYGDEYETIDSHKVTLRLKGIA